MIDQIPIYQFREEHHYTLDRMENCKGMLFITGRAGTGKSTLLNVFKKITAKKYITLAPTGIAAINVKGQTIHSFFKFPFGLFSSKDYKPISKSLLKNLDLIIIDEISMVRADLLDHIDQILKQQCSKDEAFGGIPLVAFGDLYQLPPVLNPEEKYLFLKQYDNPYFFASRVFQNLVHFEMIELNQIFRQKEKYFIGLLQHIRENDMDYDLIDEINERCFINKQTDTELSIHLCSTNRTADFINQNKLNELSSTLFTFQANIQGQVLASQYPTDAALKIKEGSQIMMIKNDQSKRFVNGSLAIVTKCELDRIHVQIEGTDKPIEIEREQWEMIRYKEIQNTSSEIQSEIIGSFSQFPLRLAWAVTIHKSQGKTFEHVTIDLGSGAFEHGQVYVAMSRCKTLEGIKLTKPLQLSDIKTDEKVNDFLRKFS